MIDLAELDKQEATARFHGSRLVTLPTDSLAGLLSLARSAEALRKERDDLELDLLRKIEKLVIERASLQSSLAAVKGALEPMLRAFHRNPDGSLMHDISKNPRPDEVETAYDAWAALSTLTRQEKP